MMYGKRIETTGAKVNLKGPGFVAVTHHFAIENALLQAGCDEHIFWIGDPRIHIGSTNIRFVNVPLLGTLVRKLGTLEVNRDKPTQGMRSFIKECMILLEKGKLIGIMPAGGTDNEIGKFAASNEGIGFLLQYAITRFGKPIPLYPVGVYQQEKTYVINFGEPQLIAAVPDRKIFHAELMYNLESLARGKAAELQLT